MQLVRLNPNRHLFRFNRRADRLIDQFLGDFFNNTQAVTMRDWNPKVDVFEEDDQIVMTAELPGVEKDNIAIDVNDRILTLKGERSSDNEVKKDRYFMRERSYGSFKRSFTLPSETDSEKIKAHFKDGVLKLNIPKPESSKPKKISIG